jgi:hypothetical protein
MPIDLTRSLMTVLLPGLVAVAPWLLWLADRFTEVPVAYAEYQVPSQALLFAVVAVTGAVLEGLATSYEDWLDKRREQRLEVSRNWFDYLANVPDHEPVGFRYMSRLATTMYFEMTMMCASLSFFPGLGFLLFRHVAPHWQAILLILTPVLMIAVALYFGWQASMSHEVLCRTRKEINERLAQRAAPAAP